MTPRTSNKESESENLWFSEQIFNQAKPSRSVYHLNGQGKSCELVHPALIRARQEYESSNQRSAPSTQVFEWNLKCFSHLSKAKEYFPNVECFGSYPFHTAMFLAKNPASAILDLEDMGAVFLTKSPLESLGPASTEIHHYLIPIWLSYALSPELWSPLFGKWPRFHQRLEKVFIAMNLLAHQSHPGFYPLKKEAQWLEEEGFFGLKTPDEFHLVFKWDFPLSGLVKLEQVLARGP